MIKIKSRSSSNLIKTTGCLGLIVMMMAVFRLRSNASDYAMQINSDTGNIQSVNSATGNIQSVNSATGNIQILRRAEANSKSAATSLAMAVGKLRFLVSAFISNPRVSKFMSDFKSLAPKDSISSSILSNFDMDKYPPVASAFEMQRLTGMLLYLSYHKVPRAAYIDYLTSPHFNANCLSPSVLGQLNTLFTNGHSGNVSGKNQLQKFETDLGSIVKNLRETLAVIWLQARIVQRYTRLVRKEVLKQLSLLKDPKIWGLVNSSIKYPGRKARIWTMLGNNKFLGYGLGHYKVAQERVYKKLMVHREAILGQIAVKDKEYAIHKNRSPHLIHIIGHLTKLREPHIDPKIGAK